MAAKLYVGGLSYSTTSETLREYFAQCGTVESASVVTDKFSGQSRGFGFVEMATAEEAQRAISELNGKDLDGRKLTVNVSNPRAPGSGGGGLAAAGVADGPGRPGGGGRRWRGSRGVRRPALEEALPLVERDLDRGRHGRGGTIHRARRVSGGLVDRYRG